MISDQVLKQAPIKPQSLQSAFVPDLEFTYALGAKCDAKIISLAVTGSGVSLGGSILGCSAATDLVDASHPITRASLPEVFLSKVYLLLVCNGRLPR